ncbi:MAG: phospho-sugar mutase [Bacteroidales bacterium]|nr:phospho-sugar mutase [Bacteroidales bacterium]
MNKQKIDPDILQRAEQWLKPEFDKKTRAAVKNLIENDPKELVEAFYKDLEFGTGGLRGIMGPGTNRMNRYTLGKATQGLANYLLKAFKNQPEIRVAIAFDSRNNSMPYALTAAEILTANGIWVYLFEALRPTPQLSFAIRTLKCQSGIVITASHNPKEYNGYKVYWDDGAQIVPPHDENIIAEVNSISSVNEVKFEGDHNLIKVIGSEIDEMYLNTLSSMSLSPAENLKHRNIKIVYTPIHGTGVDLVPKVLHKFGFSSVATIPEQNVIDGNFPTVDSPNPEDPAALKLALDKAKKMDADIVMATDPDADRVGIGVKDNMGNFILLNGNQAAALLIHYVLTKWDEKKWLRGNEYIVKTIVTSNLLADIAANFKVECKEVLTGFKYIAEVIRQNERSKVFIAGGEESYGYLVGSFVRDKDAVLSCAMFAEIVAWAKEQGKTVYQILIDLYTKYGLYHERLLSITRKGMEGAEEINRMMDSYRSSPPKELGGSKVVIINDYLKQQSFKLEKSQIFAIKLPKSNVIQFITDDGSRVSIRPSGTEPKIKFYFGVKANMQYPAEYELLKPKLHDKIDGIIKELGLKNK